MLAPAEGVAAVTFDLDFTLWDLTGVIQRAEERQYEFLCRECPQLRERYSLRDLFKHRLRLREQMPHIGHDVTAMRREALRQLGDELGFDRKVADEAFRVFLDARHEVSLYDDTKPLLDTLRERYVLGTITNGNADVQRLGLSGYFKFVLSPMDVGAAKPDRVIFEAAHHRAGVAAERIVHVGDEPESDVIGAARYGMIPVWLNRAGVEWPAELERPDCIELDSLRALGELLEKWGRD